MKALGLDADDDKALLEGLRAGDETARIRFYRVHKDRIFAICVNFLGYQDPEAEDVLQQTFLVALQKLEGFEGRSTLYTWMAHICVNLCYERLRRRKRQAASEQETLERLLISRAEDVHREKGDSDRRRVMMEKIREALGGIREECRTVVTLRDLDGLSYAEVGKRLKIPLGTVMSRLARCRRALKILLEGGPQP